MASTGRNLESRNPASTEENRESVGGFVPENVKPVPAWQTEVGKNTGGESKGKCSHLYPRPAVLSYFSHQEQGQSPQAIQCREEEEGYEEFEELHRLTLFQLLQLFSATYGKYQISC